MPELFLEHSKAKAKLVSLKKLLYDRGTYLNGKLTKK